ETKAIGEIVAAKVLNDSDNSVGKSTFKAAKIIPKTKAIKGGKSTIFFTTDSDCFLLEYIPATRIPKVESTIKVPGRSTIISVLSPSFPNKASITGIPTNEVFPKPPVITRQPMSFLLQPSCFPKKVKNKNEAPKLIQATEAGNSKSSPKLIFGR